MLSQYPSIQEWVYGVLHGEPEPPGDFLKHVAEAAVRADPDNFLLLIGAIVPLMRKYPKYSCTCQKWG